MEFLEFIIGLTALFVALRALNMQRYEIERNGRIAALVHASEMLQDKIDYHNKIITDMKLQGKKYEEWEGHAARINKEFRPLKERVNKEFLDLSEKYDGILHAGAIKKALSNKQV